MRSILRLLRSPVVVLAFVSATLVACDGSPLSTAPYVFGGGTGSTGTIGGGGTGTGNSGSAMAQLIALENQQRSASGLKTLSENSALDRAAALLCSEIAQTGVYAHDQPGTQYPTTEDRAAAAGYTNYTELAEGYTASDNGTPSFLLNYLMNQADSRPIILDSTVTEIGAAQVPNVAGHICTAQLFGAR